jgi:DNA-directed RNA polymerase subunit RPC12/RpoP
MINRTISQLAKEGKPEAIAALINERLTPRGINANVDKQENCLEIVLKSERVIDQKVIVPFIEKGITALSIKAITEISICAKRIGEDAPYWHQNVKLFSDQANQQPSLPQDNSIESPVNTLESLAKTFDLPDKIELQNQTLESLAKTFDLPDKIEPEGQMIESQVNATELQDKIELEDPMIESQVNATELQNKIELEDPMIESQVNATELQDNEQLQQDNEQLQRDDESASQNRMIKFQGSTALQDNTIELQANMIELQNNTIELQDNEIEITQSEPVQKFTIPKIEEPNRVFSIILGTLGILLSLFLLAPILARVLGIVGIIASFGLLVNGFSEAMFLKGECPYCGTATSVMSNQLGTDCKACKKRILVKKNRFYRVD